ncbi:hypothetical protein CRG98_028227 [Punica granatum]|uniref:PIG-P domain-containing protein n=1 Tax=Punica granatum TaxID=22663 RepID=A0A2I0J6N8_PUNGR|nr:hypothetical protein CRG98_028227 [Punica granatum]
MEEPHSVSSPRRILSLSKKKKAIFYFSDSEDKTSGFGVSGEHVIFLTWAYVPEHWLPAIGIFYYPSRYWALAIPVYVMVTVVLALGFYVGLNFMSTPPPTSINTLFDEFSREPSSSSLLADGDELPIEPISDIGIDEINRRMFGSVN